MTIEIFALGACLLQGPLSAAMRKGQAMSSFSRFSSGQMPAVYTIDEALQLVRFLKGSLDIPVELRPYCSILPGLDQHPSEDALDTADVVILEVNSPVRIVYRNYSLVRAELIDRIFAPIRDTSPEVYRAIDSWYTHGLMNLGSDSREGAARILADAVPDTMPDAALVRSILLESSSHFRSIDELADGIAELRDISAVPLGIMTYTHQYMPDGRPLPWPPDFVEQQIEAATRLGIPYFEPSRLVRSEGVASALQQDRVHYQDDFQSVIGDALVEFASHVVQTARRKSTKEYWNLSTPYRHAGGKLWLAELPAELYPETDSTDEPHRCDLLLWEDDHELTPGHSLHQTIELVGQGHHSFWRTLLYFSSSDGTDPNSNGRTYTVVRPRNAARPAGAALPAKPLVFESSIRPSGKHEEEGYNTALAAPAREQTPNETFKCPYILIFTSKSVNLDYLYHPLVSEDYLKSTRQQEPQPFKVFNTFPIPGEHLPVDYAGVDFDMQAVRFPHAGEYYFYSTIGPRKILILEPGDKEINIALQVFAFASRNLIHSRSDAWLCARNGHSGGPFFSDRLAEKLFFSDQPLQLHCAYASCFLVFLLHSQGVMCRLAALTGADLGGHVLLEIWDRSNGRWIALDPDFGVAVSDDTGRLLSAAEISRLLLDIDGSTLLSEGRLRVIDLAKKTWNKVEFDLPLFSTGYATWRPDWQTNESAAAAGEYVRSWRASLGTIKYERVQFDDNNTGSITWLPWAAEDEPEIFP